MVTLVSPTDAPLPAELLNLDISREKYSLLSHSLSSVITTFIDDTVLLGWNWTVEVTPVKSDDAAEKVEREGISMDTSHTPINS